MELKQLRSFLAVARALSFSRAARELHLSQPALSAQIMALEHDLGVRLFDRNRRTVALTPAGHSLVTDAESLLQQAADARLRASLVATGDAGHLRLAFVASASAQLLPAIALAFRSRYPRVTFELRNIPTTVQLAALADRTLDAGLVRLPLTAPTLTLTPLHREPFAIVLSRAHPLAATPHLTVAQLAAEPFIAYGRRWAPEFYDTWVAICTRAGFTPNVLQETSEMDTALALVAAGMGVAILPYGVAQRNPAELRVLPLATEKTRSIVGLAIRKDDPNPLVRNLVTVAKQVAKRLSIKPITEPQTYE